MTGIDIRDDGLQSGAISSIQRAWERYDKDYTAGCMSCAIYDTAWISMVSKVISDGKRWLFPQSFDYLLSMQSEDGSWRADGTPSQVDGIFYTAASLLSLHRHRLEPLNTAVHAIDDIERRIHRATASLATQLTEWDVAATVHVGFEIIVPSLLDMLRAENLLPDFQFSGGVILGQLNSAKLSKFEPGMLYSRKASTAVHSLEVFIGKVDFDKLSHHKSNGSTMGSPSSTAAYLIHTSHWDDEAEAYLRHVVAAGAGKGSGAVPSAFPSAYFEYTWMLSAMLSAGFSMSELGCIATEEMVSMLRCALTTNNGILGFAPSLPPDADDTAQCIVCLRRLGRTASPDAMIKCFESTTHFRTYFSERNPSFTANCNVLSALLAQTDVSRYSDQIFDIVGFLCDYWWENDGYIMDKWNLSHHYASLLAVQSMMELLGQIDKGNLKPLSYEMQSKINITLFQICFRALLDKPSPASTEETAYRVLVLVKARRMPIFHFIRDHMDHEITSQVDWSCGHRE
ncbi:hypothetical protein CC80DRAFT_160637 [Byssothecium circinans]|uniref:Terpenoid cyclases/Protein prenyltransferase n=1 Tax=Byssothecium circinans TaxID=147558 RepID=A0A6A5UBW8_9PLEO|nr:hypothetical protein CC80DRAFT_160637 [Byssothecium circinans]